MNEQKISERMGEDVIVTKSTWRKMTNKEVCQWFVAEEQMPHFEEDGQNLEYFKFVDGELYICEELRDAIWATDERKEAYDRMTRGLLPSEAQMKKDACIIQADGSKVPLFPEVQ